MTDYSMAEFQDDWRRKRWNVKSPKKAGDSLGRLIALRGFGQPMTANVALAAWNAAVGERFAKHTRVGRVIRGRLEVQVRNSTVLMELSLSKTRIVAELNKAAPEQNIRDVKLKIGPID